MFSTRTVERPYVLHIGCRRTLWLKHCWAACSRGAGTDRYLVLLAPFSLPAQLENNPPCPRSLPQEPVYLLELTTPTPVSKSPSPELVLQTPCPQEQEDPISTPHPQMNPVTHLAAFLCSYHVPGPNRSIQGLPELTPLPFLFSFRISPVKPSMPPTSFP